MTQKASSFYLPSPDDLYKDLWREMQSDFCDLKWQKERIGESQLAYSPDVPQTPGQSRGARINSTEAGKGGIRELQSDLYDLHWHKHQIDSLDSSTYSGTLRSYTPPHSSEPRIIRVECFDRRGFDFETWYMSVIDPSGGERFCRSQNDMSSCYIMFESAEDASLVYEYLKTVVADSILKITLCTLESAHGVLYPNSGIEAEGAFDQYTSSNPPVRLTTSYCENIPLNRLGQQSQASSMNIWESRPDTGDHFDKSFDEHRQKSTEDSLSCHPFDRLAAADPNFACVPSSESNNSLNFHQGKIIHVVMMQNTCLDKVIEIMSSFGKIDKIIMFTKDTNTQALIEYRDARSALKSVQECHSDGMTVQFSRLSELKIQQNNNRAWDFTLAPVRVMSARSSSPISLISIGFNEILSMKKLPKEMRDWLKSITEHQKAEGNKMEPVGPFGNVLIVYNLSCNSVNEIFNIFSIYGVCTRVKFLRQKDSCALVQYSDPVYASFAKYFLSHTYLWTSPGLQISYSKIDYVKLGLGASSRHQSEACAIGSAANQALDLMSRAYSQSEQRFCEAPKYGNCVSFPSETIFVASIAEGTTKARLLELFGSIGRIVAYDLRLPYSGGPKKPHMLLQYTDVNTALRAIASLHNLILDGSQIKIAFSKVRLMR